MQFKENKMLSRNWLSNPYQDISLISRLSQSEAVDLRGNFYERSINDSYNEILPIDKSKKFKEN